MQTQLIYSLQLDAYACQRRTARRRRRIDRRMQHAHNLPADRKTPLVSRGFTKNEVKTKYYINTTTTIKLENNLDSLIVW